MLQINRQGRRAKQNEGQRTKLHDQGNNLSSSSFLTLSTRPIDEFTVNIARKQIRRRNRHNSSRSESANSQCRETETCKPARKLFREKLWQSTIYAINQRRLDTICNRHKTKQGHQSE